MLKKILLVHVLLFISITLNAQGTLTDNFKYKATYKITYQPDSTDVNSVKSESMVLYLGNKISRFSSLGTAVGDSLMKKRNKSDKGMAAFMRLRAQIPETSFDYIILKGIPQGDLSFMQKIAKDKYQYVEDIDQFDWKIQSETKEISGYEVQKAETSFAGRNYTAWFAPEISISDGPYKFNGLPGLIIEIFDAKNQYSFKLTSFEKLKEPLAFKFEAKTYISIKKKDFLTIIEDYKRDPFAALEQQGITLDFQPGQKEKMMKEHREKLKKENNPIELE